MPQNSKTIALAATLAAFTIVLNPAFIGPAIPAPFIPIVNYHIYEIPIVVAFLLVGARCGFLITVLNAAVMQAVFPDSPFIRPLPNLVAISSMLLGVHLAQKLVTRRMQHEKPTSERKLVALATAFGMLLRNAVMRSLNYVSISYALMIFGPPMPEPAMLTLLFLLTIFDLTLVMYTVPVGYLIARTVGRALAIWQNRRKPQTYRERKSMRARKMGSPLGCCSRQKLTCSGTRKWMPRDVAIGG